MQAAASALRSLREKGAPGRDEPTVALGWEDQELHQRLLQDVAVSEGLTQFAKDFVRCLSGHLELVDQLLAVLRAMDGGLEAAQREAEAQVWALATGVKATAPRVATEVKKQMTQLQHIRSSTEKVFDLLEQKRSALQEREHYRLKVDSLRKEFTERERQGKGNSREQLHKLSRNQEKLAYAEAELSDAASLSGKRTQEQLQGNRRALLGALHGLAQGACCGWLVSAGAVVCRALQTASAAEEPEPPEPGPPGVMVLPQSLAQEDLEPPRFDPEFAFKESEFSREIFEVEPVESSAVFDSDSLTQLSVRQLRERIRERGLSDNGLVEKSELVDLLRRTEFTGRAEGTEHAEAETSESPGGATNASCSPERPGDDLLATFG